MRKVIARFSSPRFPRRLLKNWLPHRCVVARWAEKALPERKKLLTPRLFPRTGL